MTDPNVQTTPEGEEVILEPGDPGYVEPGQQQESGQQGNSGQESVTGEQIREGDAFGPDEPLGAEAPLGEDLTLHRRERETDAEFLARTRGAVVVSESPTDVVPNTPQVTMGQRIPVEGSEGLVTSAPDPGAMPFDEAEEEAEVEEEQNVEEEQQQA